MSEDKWDKTKIVIRTQEEIDNYKKLIGYRKARKKRYGRTFKNKISINN